MRRPGSCVAAAALVLLVLAPGKACHAQAPQGPGDQRVLVLLEDLITKSTHSLFFSGLTSRGAELEYRSIADSSIKVRDYDRWLYDKIVLFASDVKGAAGCRPAAGAAAVASVGREEEEDENWGLTALNLDLLLGTGRQRASLRWSCVQGTCMCFSA